MTPMRRTEICLGFFSQYATLRLRLGWWGNAAHRFAGANWEYFPTPRGADPAADSQRWPQARGLNSVGAGRWSSRCSGRAQGRIGRWSSRPRRPTVRCVATTDGGRRLQIRLKHISHLRLIGRGGNPPTVYREGRVVPRTEHESAQFRPMRKRNPMATGMAALPCSLALPPVP